MATFRSPTRRTWATGVLMGLGVLGCSDKTTPPTTPTDVEVKVAAKDEQGNPVVAAPKTETPKSVVDPKFTQSFAQAAITDDIPEGVQLPVDRTISGKATGMLRVAVEREWDRLEVVTPDTGKPIPYVATVETNLGSFQITLRPDVAPNHVRNFLVLAKIGYYDGLRVDRVCHQVEVDASNTPKSALDVLKLGCPLGIGEEGRGHIGYFMKPEFSAEVQHEEGTVGFWHEDTAESAGTRLYVTLGPAPLLDGSYTVVGKVTSGLDVLKRIAATPASGETYPEIEIPRDPITITKVTFSKP